MKKIKIVTVLGTRPEIIRLSEIIKSFNKYFDHYLVFTGQNFSKELSDFFFKNFEINKKISLKINNSHPARAIADIIVKTDRVLEEIKPDCFFVLGDTNSALSAISAKKRKIPIFHYEAGNRCFDETVPEEVNRKIVDHIADINLTYSTNAKQNLINENFPNDCIINLGSPLREVLEKNKDKIFKNNILNKLKVKKNNYILLSLHREENIDQFYKLKKIINSINYIVSKLKTKMIVSLHPRTKKKIAQFKLNKNIVLFQPFDFFDYNNLQINSKIVLSDSGSISEESYILNFPALNLRDTHERHEAMEKCVVPMSTFDKDKILQLIEATIDSHVLTKNNILDYDQMNVSKKIVKLIPGYINYIKKKKYYQF